MRAAAAASCDDDTRRRCPRSTMVNRAPVVRPRCLPGGRAGPSNAGERDVPMLQYEGVRDCSRRHLAPAHALGTVPLEHLQGLQISGPPCKEHDGMRAEILYAQALTHGQQMTPGRDGKHRVPMERTEPQAA